MRVAWAAVIALSFIPATAGAAPGPREVDYVVVEPSPSPWWHAGRGVIYLNRCVGGCTVRAGADDAVANTSSILGREGLAAEGTLAASALGQEPWDRVVECVRATYALYNVDVVTEPPAIPHVEVMVAGSPSALGLAGNTLGIAPLTTNCSRIPSAIAFAFANNHPAGSMMVAELCETAAHEAGHIFGLDHAFDCRDPMTYLTGCTPKIFLNRTVECGEFAAARPCHCTARQSSHQHLTRVLGAGGVPAPSELQVVSPMPDAQVPSMFSVFVTISGRPVATVELWGNGAKLDELSGEAPSSLYELRTPTSLADGVIDLEIRVYDDLGQRATAQVSVLKGARCVSSSTCPGGWTCDAGRCLAPPGTGELGEVCANDGECATKQCGARGELAACTQPCWPIGAACPDGLACELGSDEGYACFADASVGGCCSAGGDPRAAIGWGWVLLALGRVRRRRRRG